MSNEAAVCTQTTNYRVWRVIKAITDEYTVVAASSSEEAKAIAERDELNLTWTIDGETNSEFEGEITGAELATEPLNVP